MRRQRRSGGRARRARRLSTVPYAWPYDCSRESLYHPGNARDFFSHGGRPSEAGFAAELARLVYCRDRAVIDRALASVGLRIVAGRIDGEGTQWFLARGNRQSFLAFRGTETDDPSDVPTDLDVPDVAWDAGCRVHGGFAAVLDQVWPQVGAALAPVDGRLVISWHSLGGALAFLSATRHRPARVYTIGCPSV